MWNVSLVTVLGSGHCQTNLLPVYTSTCIIQSEWKVLSSPLGFMWLLLWSPSVALALTTTSTSSVQLSNTSMLRIGHKLWPSKSSWWKGPWRPTHLKNWPLEYGKLTSPPPKKRPQITRPSLAIVEHGVWLKTKWLPWMTEKMDHHWISALKYIFPVS